MEKKVKEEFKSEELENNVVNKKNSVLLTVIAVGALLVAVIGATYAYFASTVDTNNNIPVNVNTTNGTGTFTSTVSGNIHFNVTADQMLQSNANNNTINISTGDVDSATINVNLTAPEGETVECSYKLAWVWDAGTNTYAGYGASGADLLNQNYVKTRVEGVAIEGAELTLALYEGNTTDGLALFTEKNMDATTMPITTIDGTAASLLYSDSISMTSGSMQKSYTAKMRFYNRTVDQSIQESKIFSGSIKVLDVVC